MKYLESDYNLGIMKLQTILQRLMENEAVSRHLELQLIPFELDADAFWLL